VESKAIVIELIFPQVQFFGGESLQICVVNT